MTPITDPSAVIRVVPATPLKVYQIDPEGWRLAHDGVGSDAFSVAYS
ncbi:MAG: hypothetical protein IPK52_20735 [Chloroflexi bacterium]|nr:hypothetical protein [Chloroflexota bacterium]